MFSKKQVTRQSIQDKSIGALSMFRAAISQLLEASNEAEGLISKNQDYINDLELENKALTKLCVENNNVIVNIESLIGSK